MPINYSDAVKAKRMDVVLEAIDDAAPNPGKLVLIVREGTTYHDAAIIPFALPSFQSDGKGVLNMLGGPHTVLVTYSGFIETARIEDGATPDPNIIGSGLRVDVSVTSNPDVLVSAINITAGNPITVYSGKITHG